MNLITEAVLDEAIEAAEAGHINGLTYDQSSWCGTACCVLGFARHIAGLPEQNIGPQDSEFSKSPKISTLKKLMKCSSPDILRVMKSVTGDGKINLSDAVLSGADLRDADLSGADLRDAVLRGVVLRGAVLSGAILSGAVLSGAILSGADLSDADLSGAVLRGVVLRGVVLRGTVLRGTDLRDADLSDAVYWDYKTKEYVEVTNEWLKLQGAIL